MEETTGALPGVVDPTPAVARDADSLVDVFDRQYLPMVRLAYLLVGSEHEAEDVVQEAFARLHLRWRAVRDPAPYLRRIVVHRCYDVLRRRRSERQAVSRLGDDVEAPREYLLDALASLPARQRVALVLRYYADLSEREIAAAMGCPSGTVKTLLHRGKAALREVIDR